MSSEDGTFARFRRAFAPRDGEVQSVDVERMSAAVERKLGVGVPGTLKKFFGTLGSGYFGRRELLFFGESSAPLTSLVDWNLKDFWKEINPPPAKGGAVFFAETCFGEQIGFRWSNGRCQVVLFIIDTFETFLLAEKIEVLFSDVLTEPGVIDDPMLTEALIERLGMVEPDMHYAPIVSPLLGGSANPDNFHLETSNVHFRTAIATRKAAAASPSGTRIAGIDVEYKR